MLSAGGCGGSDSGTGADHGGTAANRRRRGSRGITEGAEGIARMIHPPASVAGVSVSDGLRHAQELRRAASVGAGAPGTGCVRRALVCLRQPPARSPEDSVLGPRRICGMEQTIRGRDVRDAAGGERGGTPAGDYSTGGGGPAEWNRPEPGRAAQAISALAINMLIFVRFCLSNSQSVSTLMEKTPLRGHRLTTSHGGSENPAEDGAGSDGPTGSRVCRAPQVRGQFIRVLHQEFHHYPLH